jgi:hypothetical protein
MKEVADLKAAHEILERDEKAGREGSGWEFFCERLADIDLRKVLVYIETLETEVALAREHRSPLGAAQPKASPDA